MNNKMIIKVVITISIILLVFTINMGTINVFSKENYKLEFEYINTKNIAKANVSNKKEIDPSILLANVGQSVKKKETKEKVEEIEIPNINKEPEIEKKLVWRLPTETGIITQYPSYYHMAYDITSYRGYNEAIYPIADGTISSIYYDNYGALIVTVLHEEKDKKYTSQYVHFSRFADGIYVGQKVDTNTIIGYMGASGIATGVHLHVTLLDCALYQDGNCYDLNAFYNYGRQRISEGYVGVGMYVNIPYNWNSR